MITVQTTVIQGPMITYWDIRNGHILDINETLYLHGISYRVVSSYGKVNIRYALVRDSFVASDDEVFTKLGIKDKLAYASLYGKVQMPQTGTFPEMDCRDSLTRLVRALYEKPEYEYGEWVTIMPRDNTSGACPFGYTHDMGRSVGEAHRIERVELVVSDTCARIADWEGDPHGYHLVGNAYTWHSSMLRKATDAEIAMVTGTPVTLVTPPLVAHAHVEELDTVRHVRRDTHCDVISDIEEGLRELRGELSSVGLDKGHDENSTKIQIPKTDKSFHIKL